MSGLSAVQQIFGGLFGGNGQQQQQQVAAPQTPAQPGNMPAQNTNPPMAGNPTVPVASAPAVTNTANQNPAPTEAPQGLDKFADLWTIPDGQKSQEPQSPFAGVTPEQLQQIAGKTDFSKVVTPELMTKISAGGEEGVAATLQALNLVAQQSYAQSAGAAIKLIEKATTDQRAAILAELPTLVKQQNVSEQLRTNNPIFDHPAAKPMLEMFQNQLALKNPTASAAQIEAQAKDFLISFATAANPQAQQQQQQQGGNKKDMDWESFLS